MILILEMPLPEKRAQNVLIDEIVEFELPEAKEKYPKKITPYGRLERRARIYISTI